MFHVNPLIHMNMNMKKYLRMSFAAVVIGTLRVKRGISWLEKRNTYDESHSNHSIRIPSTVDSHYLEIEGTLKNSSRYPYFDISDL